MGTPQRNKLTVHLSTTDMANIKTPHPNSPLDGDFFSESQLHGINSGTYGTECYSLG